MALVNRHLLKEYFRTGKKPTEQNFGDLIDSVPNLQEDSLYLKDENGLRLYPVEQQQSVIQFFPTQEEGQDLNNKKPLWRLSMNEDNSLSVDNTEGIPVLKLKPDTSVEICGNLDVKGCISAAAYSGLYGADNPDRYMYAPADGKWHTIRLDHNEYMHGCRMYHIVAGCGGRERYALLEATVMICFGDSPRIRKIGSWLGTCFNKIKLRWDYEGDAAALQIKAKKRQGKDTGIRYRVTELWNDYFMENK